MKADSLQKCKPWQRHVTDDLHEQHLQLLANSREARKQWVFLSPAKLPGEHSLLTRVIYHLTIHVIALILSATSIWKVLSDWQTISEP